MIQFFIDLFLGANVGLFLYAYILVEKNADKNFIEMGNKIERRK